MFIIIVGQGKVGATLAAQLSAEGHELVLVDSNGAFCSSFRKLWM